MVALSVCLLLGAVHSRTRTFRVTSSGRHWTLVDGPLAMFWSVVGACCGDRTPIPLPRRAVLTRVPERRGSPPTSMPLRLSQPLRGPFAQLRHVDAQVSGPLGQVG
jgi:hypothetical protein